jgi:DeoR/GlpR family transcriptional regulator of sugar metabolism
MKWRQREELWLHRLSDGGELPVAEACSLFGISEATARRDMIRLSEKGLVNRTWGGVKMAGAKDRRSSPPAFVVREGKMAREKLAIARAAADLVSDGDVVMIDGGTTTVRLCRYLVGKRVRIITNSLAVALELEKRRVAGKGPEVLLAGGLLQPDSWLVAGPSTEDFLRRYHADWAMLSAAGLDSSGATNYEETVLASERLMIAQSRQVALMLDSAKLGVRGMCRLCAPSDLDVLVTDADRGHPVIRSMRHQGVRWMGVDTGKERLDRSLS